MCIIGKKEIVFIDPLSKRERFWAENAKNVLSGSVAQKKAHRTEKNALTFTKYRLNKLGWRYIDFQSKRGYPRTGIIDLVAVKLDKKDPDKLKIILFQVKGGTARIKEEHKQDWKMQLRSSTYVITGLKNQKSQ